MRKRTSRLAGIALGLVVLGATSGRAAELPKGETQQIAEEALIYGFPMVMNYAAFLMEYLLRP
jgi:hypothetical protein